jgi:hypothetical protein
VTLIFTTDGSTEDATFSTDPDGAAAALDALTGPDVEELVVVSSPFKESYAAAPPTPAAPPRRRAPASTAAVIPPGLRVIAVALPEAGCWNGGSGRVEPKSGSAGAGASADQLPVGAPDGPAGEDWGAFSGRYWSVMEPIVASDPEKILCACYDAA